MNEMRDFDYDTCRYLWCHAVLPNWNLRRNLEIQRDKNEREWHVHQFHKQDGYERQSVAKKDRQQQATAYSKSFIASALFETIDGKRCSEKGTGEGGGGRVIKMRRSSALVIRCGIPICTTRSTAPTVRTCSF